jgi:hypothetical protein
VPQRWPLVYPSAGALLGVLVHMQRQKQHSQLVIRYKVDVTVCVRVFLQMGLPSRLSQPVTLFTMAVWSWCVGATHSKHTHHFVTRQKLCKGVDGMEQRQHTPPRLPAHLLSSTLSINTKDAIQGTSAVIIFQPGQSSMRDVVVDN